MQKQKKATSFGHNTENKIITIKIIRVHLNDVRGYKHLFQRV